MKIKNISVDKFRTYLSKINPKHMFSKLNDEKIKELVKIKKLKLKNFQDIKNLGKYDIVWYKNNKGKIVKWNSLKARNLSVEEKTRDYKKKPLRSRVGIFVNKLRKGLKKDIEIIIINDLISNKKLIVDGVNRSAALYYFCIYEKYTLRKILSSEHSIFLIELTSTVSSLLFPLDFLNIYRDYKVGSLKK